MKKITAQLTTLFLAVSVFAGGAAAVSLDQRDPNYQKSIEHYAQAQANIRNAILHLQKGEAYYEQPSIQLVRMLAPLQEIENSLNYILMPEQRRHKYQTLVPDGQYFQPSPLKEHLK
jgi:hypothetical protein